MLKLMKYEFLRRRKFLMSILLLFLFLEGVAVYGMYRGENWLILSVGLMLLMFFAALILPLVDAIANYYSDFKNTHGYMLFLTPNNGYQIIGSKALFAFIELLLSICLVGLFLLANFHIARGFGYEEVTNQISLILQQVPQVFGSKASASAIIALLSFTGILQYFNTIMLAITALTFGKTLLSAKNYNWLFALLLYFALAIGVQTINGLALTAFGFVGDMLNYAQTPDMLMLQTMKYIFVGMGLYVFWIAAGYVSSSMLLSKRVDL